MHDDDFYNDLNDIDSGLRLRRRTAVEPPPGTPPGVGLTLWRTNSGAVRWSMKLHVAADGSDETALNEAAARAHRVAVDLDSQLERDFGQRRRPRAVT